MNEPAEAASALKGILHDKTFTFEWEIQRFFGDCEKLGDDYVSPKFTIQYADQITKWYMIVYPKGEEEKTKDDVSLFVYCESENDVIMTVNQQCSMLSQQNIVFKKVTETYKLKGPCYAWGWSDFIEQSVIEDGLIDDTLTIICKITFYPPDQDISKCYHGYDEWLEKIDDRFRNYEELLESGGFTDVTFTVQDKKIDSHKAILSCQSPVFKAMFEHDMKENKQNSVDIIDISYDVMKELLRFMYSGKVNNIEQIASELLIAADKYQVTELKALCEKTLYEKITVDNVVEYLKLTELCETILLKTLLIEFVADHIDIVKKSEFTDLDKNVMHEILLTVAENANKS